jgi:hypothetical protein
MSLDLSRSLGISKHADLKTRKDGSILVLPERAIRLGGSGAEILGLVAEKRIVEAVLNAMRARYPDSSDSCDSYEVETEVLRFLEEMLSLGALVDLDECSERTA